MKINGKNNKVNIFIGQLWVLSDQHDHLIGIGIHGDHEKPKTKDEDQCKEANEHVKRQD